jgi:hypothetical protein
MVMFEMSPISVGVRRAAELSDHLVSGITDTYRARECEGKIDKSRVPSLLYYISASSWAPAILMSHFPIVNKTVDFQMNRPYKSPDLMISDPSSAATDFLMCDGCNLDNFLLISMIQRKVDKVVVFVSAQFDLMKRKDWKRKSNGEIDYFNCIHWKPRGIGYDLTSYFGFYCVGSNRDNYQNNHIFEKMEFIELVDALHRAQEDGNGLIATLVHTTVANSHWGIEAGWKVEVTWVLLGKLSVWENLLHDKDEFENLMNVDIVVKINKCMPCTSNIMPSSNFPNIATALGGFTTERANAVGSIAGWTILRNANRFRAILSDANVNKDETFELVNVE